MNKIPPVERDLLTGGLTIACASLWYAFLAEEKFWEGSTELSEYYKRRSQELSVAPTGSLHDRQLEETIKKWKR